MFTIQDAKMVCNRIVEQPVKNFSGLAFVVYTKEFDKSYLFNLRPNLKLPEFNYFVDADKFIDYLNIGSKLGGVIHDGFHFIYENGTITESAQYFVPKPVSNLTINELCGTRYHSALFGSVLHGVKFIVTISSNKSIYIFKNGKIVFQKKSKDYKEP